MHAHRTGASPPIKSPRPELSWPMMMRWIWPTSDPVTSNSSFWPRSKLFCVSKHRGASDAVKAWSDGRLSVE